jgi:NitT/TauT family transport system ATP-binding protein/sulfonate transport system ATP-binding protein
VANSDIKIVCKNVSKTFVQKGKQIVPVLEDISLEVRDEEFLVVLGPGQCGKSTLLRTICGLETPTSGSVTLDGRKVKGPGPEIGLVFQSYMLFPWETVRNNVEIGLRINGLSDKEARGRADHYLEMVGLMDFADYFPHQLSGGMKQRVGIARAYALQPKVLLLDEPFGQLDAQTRFFMEQETARIWQMEKRTMIFVTNNIDEAIFLGDRIVTMEGKLPGRLSHAHTIDLPRPRDSMDIRFLEYRNRITEEQKLTL